MRNLIALLYLLASSHGAFYRGIVSNGTYFNPCTASKCKHWCEAIPCCERGLWQNEACWLYSMMYSGPVPTNAKCESDADSKCVFRKTKFGGSLSRHGGSKPSVVTRGRKLKLCFHINQLTERGVERSTFDYAFFAKQLLGHDAVFLTASAVLEGKNDPRIVERFVAEFGEFHTYNNTPNWTAVHGPLGGPALAEAVHNQRCHMLYCQKSGDFSDPPVIEERWLKVPWAVHAVFSLRDIHGTAYASISRTITASACPRGPTVSYMVYPLARPRLVNASDSPLRQQLGVGDTDLLLCRHGAVDTFDIPWVRSAVVPLAFEFPNLHFLFLNTRPLPERHERVHYLPSRITDGERLQYFEACDGMLHARTNGESFGLSVAEMSVHNRPVLTCTVCGFQQHVHILGPRALPYHNVKTLRFAIAHLLRVGRQALQARNWNAYRSHRPEKVMREFDEVFIQPALVYWELLRKMGITEPWDVPVERLPRRFFPFLRAYDTQEQLRPSFDEMLSLTPALCSSG
eukprot:GGOE01042623.1.p1 GENE.GGOE01042623.1~~GGOE01042623.1.p1  ORF type:complete len:527 (+),score=135.22 GGOE01042623.1:39-1583(+)